eukprot:6863745-Lingulodinium_polyedra.AAC.1
MAHFENGDGTATIRDEWRAGEDPVTLSSKWEGRTIFPTSDGEDSAPARVGDMQPEDVNDFEK